MGADNFDGDVNVGLAAVYVCYPALPLPNPPRTDCRPLMSALPPKADITEHSLDVRFVPLTSDLRLDAPQQSLLRYSMRPAAI
jgi:hypothetical protein